MNKGKMRIKITDLLDKQKPEIVEEFENLSQSEASKVVGGGTSYNSLVIPIEIIPYMTRYTPSSPSKGMR